MKFPRKKISLKGIDPVRIGLAGYLLVVLGPVLVLAADLLLALLGGEVQDLSLLVPSGPRLILLLKSLGLALAVAGGGTAIGLLAGLFFLDKPARLTRSIFLAVVLIGTLPPYVHALSWNHLADTLNALLTPFGFSIFILRGWAAGWWVWVMALTPLSFCLILAGLNTIDRELLESGRVLKDDLAVLKGILLPLLKPYLLLSAGLLFLISLIDYSIPALFQTTSYALSLFADFSAYHQSWRVFLLSLPLLLIVLLVVFSLHRAVQRITLKPIWGQGSLATPYEWPAWLAWTQTISAGIAAILVLVPVFSLISLNSSLAQTIRHISAAAGEISFSLTTGLAAAVLGTALGYALARFTHSSPLKRYLTWLLVSTPVIIPSTLIGIGLITIWNQDFLPGIYNSGAMPVLASAARFAPFASLVFLAQLRTLQPELMEAAELLQESGWLKWVWVKVPLTAPGWIAAGLIVFIFSLGELGATLLVVPAGRSTLTIRIYNFLHYGASETVASLALMISLLALLAGSLVLLISLAWYKYLGGQKQP